MNINVIPNDNDCNAQNHENNNDKMQVTMKNHKNRNRKKPNYSNNDKFGQSLTKPIS